MVPYFLSAGRHVAEDVVNPPPAALIREATETIAQHEGRPPAGWMGPWISETPTTPDLLKEAGYTYLMDWPCDDQPFWMRTRSGPILHVPYPVEINDSPAHLNRRHTAADFRQMLTDQFDQMVELSRQQPLVMGLALHTFVVGQPFRLRQLRKALAHIVNHPRADSVWFTRPGEIAAHVLSLPDGIVP